MGGFDAICVLGPADAKVAAQGGVGVCEGTDAMMAREAFPTGGAAAAGGWRVDRHQPQRGLRPDPIPAVLDLRDGGSAPTTNVGQHRTPSPSRSWICTATRSRARTSSSPRAAGRGLGEPHVGHHRRLGGRQHGLHPAGTDTTGGGHDHRQRPGCWAARPARPPRSRRSALGITTGGNGAGGVTPSEHEHRRSRPERGPVPRPRPCAHGDPRRRGDPAPESRRSVLRLMLGRRPDAARVIPGLWVGSAPTARQAKSLAGGGISVVVDLRGEGGPPTPLARGGPGDPRSRSRTTALPAAAEVSSAASRISRLLRDGEEVLVHCRAGLERSPTIVCAVLMLQGWSLADAYRRVAEARAGRRAHRRPARRPPLRSSARRPGPPARASPPRLAPGEPAEGRQRDRCRDAARARRAAPRRSPRRPLWKRRRFWVPVVGVVLVLGRRLGGPVLPGGQRHVRWQEPGAGRPPAAHRRSQPARRRPGAPGRRPTSAAPRPTSGRSRSC